MEEIKPDNVPEIGGFAKRNIRIISAIAILLIIFLSIYVRTSNIENLKDVTTGNYTLGPDLDPFLYLRNAREIVAENLKNPDMMISAPLGNNAYAYGSLMPWMIVCLYKFLNIFSDTSIEYAAIILPVILTGFAVLFFFLFAQKAFSFMMKKEYSYFGALIASLLYAVIPQMLHRTTSGVPEIESLGMPFFWLAFYFFLSAWQSEKLRSSIIFAVLSGISTGLMIWSWGGYRYIFMSFSLAAFIAFFFQKISRKNIAVFGMWWIFSIVAGFIKTPSISGIFSSLPDFLFSSVIFFILVIDVVLYEFIFKKRNFNIKIPRNVFSMLVAGILMIILASVLLGPSFIIEKVFGIIDYLIKPFGGGRVGLTVAENRTPYFVEVSAAFAVKIGNLAISLFWLFFFGTILMFYQAIKHFNKRNKYILSITFAIFLLGFIFSKISPNSALNGDNLISKILYFGSLLLLVFVVIYLYFKERLMANFKEINFAYIVILSLIFFSIISMRGAVRLFFIISPSIIIASAYLPAKLFEIANRDKEKLIKVIYVVLTLLLIIIIAIIAFKYSQQSYNETQYSIPGINEQQWQYAMGWVRNNTAPNDIFVHWWDYGYWIQTIGERPTVTDGGHWIEFWDHTTARYLMTAENEKTTLQLMKAHNVSYVLFDTSDIGKYSAYSSIASDKTGKDRLSWIPSFELDEKQTQELKNETVYVYTGGFAFDRDLIWNGNLLPQEKAIIPGFLVHLSDNQVNSIEAVVIYNNQRQSIPLQKVYLNNTIIQLTDEGLDAILYFVPRLQGNQINPMGSALFLSEKVSNSQFARMYLLEDTDFELAHKEDAEITKQINQIYNLGIEFVSANGGIFGPIKIFKVPDISDIEYHAEYLERKSLEEGDFAKLDYLGT